MLPSGRYGNIHSTTHALNPLNTILPRVQNQNDSDIGKGVAMVVMEKQNYIKKAQNLLKQTNIYRAVVSHPTNKHKTKLIFY